MLQLSTALLSELPWFWGLNPGTPHGIVSSVGSLPAWGTRVLTPQLSVCVTLGGHSVSQSLCLLSVDRTLWGPL